MLNHISERKIKMLSYDLVIADLLARENRIITKEKDLLLKEKLLDFERERRNYQ